MKKGRKDENIFLTIQCLWRASKITVDCGDARLNQLPDNIEGVTQVVITFLLTYLGKGAKKNILTYSGSDVEMQLVDTFSFCEMISKYD